MHARWWVLGVVVGCAGCGAPDPVMKQPDAPTIMPDARPDASPDAWTVGGDFSCATTAWPTTAPAMLALNGGVVDGAGTPLAGTTVTIYKASTHASIGMATTNTNGAYTINVTTMGNAPAIYRTSGVSGQPLAYVFDPVAVFDAAHAGPLAVSIRTTSQLDAMYAVGGLTRDLSEATLMISVLDCVGQPVTGALVNVGAAEKLIYVKTNGMLDKNLTLTQLGTAVALNVPAGPVVVTIQAGPVTYRAWQVEAFANAFVVSPRVP